MSDKIKSIFLDPSLGFISKHKLKVKLKKQGITITDKELDEFYKNHETPQVNKKIVVKKVHKITAPPDCYQIDVILFPQYLKKRNGTNKFLVLIEILSRKAYVYPIKSNKMSVILEAYEEFIEDVGGKVLSVEGDNEFNNKAFLAYNEELEIIVNTDIAKDDHITKFGNKLGIVDAFVKNLKNRVRLYMETNDTLKFIDVLDDIVKNYNETPHSSLNDESPIDAKKDPVLLTKIRMENAEHNTDVSKKITLKVGDHVRVVVGKKVFEKAKATFSKEIHEILEKVGNKYRVSDLSKLYKHYELLKVDKAKVIENKKTKVLKSAKEASSAERKILREGITPHKSGRQKGTPKKREAIGVDSHLDKFVD